MLLPLRHLLYRSISRTLLDKVFAQVAVVVAAWTAAHNFTLRAYLDRAVTDENAADLDTLIRSSTYFPLDYFRRSSAEIVTATATVQHWDALSGCVFARVNKTRFTH